MPTDPHKNPSNAHPRPRTPATAPVPVGPPSKHHLAVMIWVAVFPTLTVLNLTIGPWLQDANALLRTFVLATVAVPIVIYGLMPRLQRIRVQVLTRLAS